MSQTGITIQVEDAWVPFLPRQFDETIVDVVVWFNFNQHQLLAINHCRLYLQAVTISDISSTSGIYLLSTAFSGERDMSRPSRLCWPSVQRP
jgi:hypothetical protein